MAQYASRGSRANLQYTGADIERWVRSFKNSPHEILGFVYRLRRNQAENEYVGGHNTALNLVHMPDDGWRLPQYMVNWADQPDYTLKEYLQKIGLPYVPQP